MINADSSSEEELLSVTFDSTEGSVHMVNEDKLPEKRIFATMEIAGENFEMQIDMGASCNVLPQKFVPSGTIIIKSDRTLKMYSKSTMPVIGTCRVRIRNPKNNKQQEVQCRICCCKRRSYTFDWISHFSANESSYSAAR